MFVDQGGKRGGVVAILRPHLLVDCLFDEVVKHIFRKLLLKYFEPVQHKHNKDKITIEFEFANPDSLFEHSFFRMFDDGLISLAPVASLNGIHEFAHLNHLAKIVHDVAVSIAFRAFCMEIFKYFQSFFEVPQKK